MNKIDRAEYQKRLDRITEMFAGMVKYADELSVKRCPYKNRFSECTAQFRCRNQQEPRPEGELLTCGLEDGLDYRSAWESNPEALEKAKTKIRAHKKVRRKKSDD
ncbi:MAG: hypothetical protein O2954_07380 [bacterium]|nr:hypothetical protein [bacterium]